MPAANKPAAAEERRTIWLILMDPFLPVDDLSSLPRQLGIAVDAVEHAR
jgi:hypothetical protein